jgi:hypothetical protein
MGLVGPTGIIADDVDNLGEIKVEGVSIGLAYSESVSIRLHMEKFT